MNRDVIYRQAAIEAINSHFGFNIEEEYGSAVQEVINSLPPAQSEQKTLDELIAIMKEYYFIHRHEYDETWENGFAKCMNLIPNVYMKRGKDR